MRQIEAQTWVAIVPTLAEVIRGHTKTRIYYVRRAIYLEALLDEGTLAALADTDVEAFCNLREAMDNLEDRPGPAVEVTVLGEITFDGRTPAVQNVYDRTEKLLEDGTAV